MRLIFSFIVTLFILNTSFAQYDSNKFTYNESDKSINFEQLEELTNKLLIKDKSFYDESTVSNFIHTDKSLLPNYSEEELHKKVLAIPSSIPLKYSSDVGTLINHFLINKREYMTRMLTFSKTYFPIFEEVLDDKNMPDELKYLAIVESALNPNARSRCGATGLWQFMHGTAKHEGMEINSLVDERSDIIKSTEHAADYLKKLYNIYGDWLLALAAYNSGPGNVNKAIKNSGGYDFWTIKHRLPRETQNYVPSFIAMVYAFHYAKEYQLVPGKPLINFQTASKEILYDKQSLKYIAELIGTNEEHIKKYNPELKKGIVPATATGYKLLLPKEYASSFQAQKHLLNLDPYIYNPAYIPPAVIPDNTTYAGTETSNSDIYNNQITIEYKNPKNSESENTSNNHSVEEKFNAEIVYSEPTESKMAIEQSSSIKPISLKQALKKTIIDEKLNASEDDEYKVVKVTESVKKMTTYTVKKGDNLYQIAKKFDVSLAEIRDWNRMDIDDNLFVGKKIKIQSTETVSKPQYVKNSSMGNARLAASQPINNESNQTSSPSSGTENNTQIVHKLKRGESLLQLSHLYGCTVEELKEWNFMEDENVKVGQDIFIYIHEASAKIRNYSYYEAKPGDTLQTASLQFNIPLEILKTLNNKDANEPLRKGEKIKIPTL